MKTQISRLSPHQNGKVFGIMLAATTLIVGVPIMTYIYVSIVFSPGLDEQGKPLPFPLFPLIGSAIYNLLFKYIGGFEFEQKDKEA